MQEIKGGSTWSWNDEVSSLFPADVDVVKVWPPLSWFPQISPSCCWLLVPVSMMHGDGSKDYVLMLIAARDTPFLNIWTLIFQILTSGLYSQFHTAWLCIVRPQTRFYPTYNCFPLLGYNQHWGVQGRRCWLLWRCRNDDSVLRLIFTTVPSSRSSGSWEGTLNRVHPPGLLVCPAHTRPGGGGLVSNV